MKDYSSH